MTTLEYNNRLMTSMLNQMAVNRGDVAGKMLTAVRNASSLAEARGRLEQLIIEMQEKDNLFAEEFRLKERK